MDLLTTERNFIQKIIFGGGFLFDFAKGIIILIVILALVHFFIATVFFVDGASMDPTFATGEMGLLDKISYNFSNPKRGDVVVVKYPGDPENKKYVKRVIGMPGEKIAVSNGAVYIEDKKLFENYLPAGLQTPQSGEWKLESDEYFLMGDNRINSNDSRYFGPVEKRFIIGKTIWILTPRFFSIPNPTYLL